MMGPANVSETIQFVKYVLFRIPGDGQSPKIQSPSLVNFYQITWCYNPEDGRLHI
jgi:hypothetical protein